LATIEREAVNQLRSLNEHFDYTIIAINGDTDSLDVFHVLGDKIILRDNVGYDAGAYKEVFENKECLQIIRQCVQLVLCNNSFYGPFIPMKELNDIMVGRNVDFWGITEINHNLVRHIQSYFLSFGEKIINDRILEQFFSTYIKKDMEFEEVLLSFENGLFRYLKMNGYSHSAYKYDNIRNEYTDPYGSVALDKVPILKKKIFTDKFYAEFRAGLALNYINKEYKYEINDILLDVKDLYERKIDLFKYENPDNFVLAFDHGKAYARKKIIDFIDENEPVYIYGIGKFAQEVYSYLFCFCGNRQLRGFVVSDNQDVGISMFHDYTVYHWSDISEEYPAVILALGKSNTWQVMQNIKGKAKIQTLWY
jgi:rhamnosyltransferase